MMPSKLTLNHQQTNKNHNPSIYSYLQNQSGLNFAPVSTASSRNDSPPPAPPVRDSSTLKSVKYGPGHEKYPSWPVPAAAETPQALRAPPGGGSHRSKSWTDHTNYPKEKVVMYTRPYMKRQHSTSHVQQKLKTVMEKCEKIPPETFDPRYDKMNNHMYLPRVDHDGKPLGDANYVVPSPPERDIPAKPQLTQADIEEYARSYQDPVKFNYDSAMKETRPHLTESGLEEFMEYTRSYEDSLFSSMDSKSDDGSLITHLHQKQLSYAQSEGYHSYVSSTDSTSTPFLDRLRRDSEAVARSNQNNWEDTEQEGRDSVVTNSSGSASSGETLKWHGSISDVSVASSSCTHLANNANSRQLIAHSARVQTPQRHHSESVLYISENNDGWKSKECRNNSTNKLKLFPINTYTVQDVEHSSPTNNCNRLSMQSALSVADRINELEKQQQQKYSYLDPDKKHKIPDPTLKAIQKKALLSFYERHHNSSKGNTWRSEPQLAQSQQPLSIPQPPPRLKVQLPSRRASSASDYASGTNSRRSSLSSRESKTTDSIMNKMMPRHQHSNSCGSLSSDLLGPVIMGPSISVDDYVPEKPPDRPPKNPQLRTTYPDLFQETRSPSPDLPPPSPPTVLEDEVVHSDEPLPPPPPECETNWRDKSENDNTGQFAAPQVKRTPSHKSSDLRRSASIKQTVGLPERNTRFSGVRSSIRTRPAELIIQQVSSKPYNIASSEKIKQDGKPEQMMGFPNQRGYAERSSTRYPTAQKLVLNGNVAVSQKVPNGSGQYRAEPLRPVAAKGSFCGKPTVDDAKSGECGNLTSAGDVPPPLQPRQMKINQSMRGKVPPDVSSYGKSQLRESRSQSLSQSKASYLASRRDRDRIVQDSESGSYKRTMSPNGHAIQEPLSEPTKMNSRETIWPLNRTNQDIIRNNNNSNLNRRISMNEKSNKISPVKEKKFPEKDDLKKANVVLPDVLPVNAKLINMRSQYPRPTQLNLQEEAIKIKSPPHSPPKSPARNSPFSPLLATNLSNHSSPIHSSPVRTSPMRTSPIRSSPVRSSPSRTPSTRSSPQRSSPQPLKPLQPPLQSPDSPKRASPQIKSPLTPIKLSPLRLSPASSNTSSPLHTSPLTSPSSSPKITPPPSPKKSEECPPVIEGLTMIQRTEVVLRVNTSTSDASSQTEKEEMPPTPLPTRRKLQEEIECEKLSEELISHLPTSDRLKELFVPGPDHKKPTDYVHGLFKVDVTSRPRPANSPFRSKNNTPSSSPPPILTTASSTNTISSFKISNSSSSSIPSTLEPTSPLSVTSTYFTTSEPKARFLTRYSQDMNQCNYLKDTKDLNQKKNELVHRLDRKLEVLRGEQLVVSEECKLNEELGENVESHIARLARPHEAAKFRLHVEEVGKITSLLLGLSGRLARAENALMGMPGDHPERRILESKRDKLLEQLEEAKSLKECIDRRSVSVSSILTKYLDSEEYADYDHFINMKAKLIMDSKEIADKIKLGEEQLLALKEALIASD